MKNILLIILLVPPLLAQNYSITRCVCSQLLSQHDCKNKKYLNCEWNSKLFKCTLFTQTQTQTYSPYCDPLSEAICQNTEGCAFVNKKCTYFTGCTPFADIKNIRCQAISSKCITDGTHCVEIDACSTYLTKIACVKNEVGAYCYWDTTKNICVDANRCDKLPTTLRSDSDCRAQIPTCTVSYQGCQDSYQHCSQQIQQEQCYWNRFQSQACYWNGIRCVDKICENAPQIFLTDADCEQFLSDGSCTTKSGGGCVTRSTCQDAKIEAACVKDINGQQCYWNDSTCVDKICTNAPTNLTTNEGCQKFMNNCITTGQGCKNNGSCNEATVYAACDKNIFGLQCIWDTTCKDKICINAPKLNNTHEFCASFLSTCTVNSSGTGCTPRTCDNAPSSLVSNENCEAYMPGAHCVTKQGGGCVKNSNCNTLDQVACVKDINDNDCYWDNYCKDKTCANAPSSANSHALCQQFLSRCTANSEGGCVDFICQNIQFPGICSTDFYGNPCIYKAQCSQKNCESAIFQTTHLACQSFNSKCILSSQGIGCAQMPQNCSDVISKAGCYLSQASNVTISCLWIGTKCVDKTCQNLDKNIQTTFDCNKELQGCVSANPINGIVAGCMSLPVLCEERLSQDNCEIQGQFTCVWNSINYNCVQKTCITASYQISNFSNLNCLKYLTGCILNNTNDGCIAQVSNCSDLISSINCGNKVKIGDGDCYWNQVSQSCVDMICENIPLTSHQDCNQVLNTCTVNDTKQNCQALTACNTYTISDQCHQSVSGSCLWTGTTCKDQTCTDAPKTYQISDNCIKFIVASGKSCYWSNSNQLCVDLTCENIDQTSNFNTHALCNKKLATCTVKVVNDVAVNGCQTLGTCSDNKIQVQCVINLTGGNCEWNINLTPAACVDKSCTSAPSSYNNHSLCKDHIGTNSCTVGVVVGANGAANILSGCIGLELLCSSYIDQEQCHINGSGGLCGWNGSTCTDFSCTTSPVTNDTHELCTTYKTGCTVNQNGNGCMELLENCTSYQIEVNCVIDTLGNNCQWNSKTKSCANISCDSIQNNPDKVMQNSCLYKECQDFQGITHLGCQAININCTVGSGGYCARIKTCADVTVSAACIKGTDGPCLWIEGVINQDGSKGACYPYTSCKSLAWKTDQKCKMISQNCTTNGFNCIGITSCSETNVNGGCVTGYDGECRSAPQARGSNYQICRIFLLCWDIQYTTHLECQIASRKCTTNGIYGCIELSACSTYTQAGCYINNSGSEKDFYGRVIRTGVCKWDNTAANCRDQICSDLTGQDHQTCFAQLSTCTSDGTSCLVQATCGTYTQSQCSVALGTNGVCFWQAITETNQTAACRVMSCEDIIYGITTSACLAELNDCVSNGISCIPKANCSTYTSKTACNSGGLDGTCVFTSSPSNDGTVEEGTCILMNSCASASNDQNACITQKQKCSWTAAENGMSSICAIHTCTSYYATNHFCANFLNWDQTKQQICQLKNGICIETDPATLNQMDCYIASGYAYTWNASLMKCESCLAPATINNSTNTNQSNSTNLTTGQTFMLSFAIVAFGFVAL